VGHRIGRVLAIAGLAALGLLAVLAVFAALDVARFDVDALATRVPARTALMLQREREARARGQRHRIDQRWMPYARIAPSLRHAVLVAEDDRFFLHEGFDWEEIRESARRNLESGRIVRGGSTITQQLAKNVFLGDRRSIDRKLREMFLAARIERALTKRRILELYLNLIEWGDGVYGAEAAARRSFGVPASQLDARQSVLLAAVIINPRRYQPTAPTRRIERRAHTIARRLWRRGAFTEDEFRLATGAPPLEAGPDTTAVTAPDTAAPAAPPVADTLPAGPDSLSLPAPP
jgi:monofunctional biosynthetic peptidoglycan transglycosylase